MSDTEKQIVEVMARPIDKDMEKIRWFGRGKPLAAEVLSALKSAGYVIVPEEPTEAMCEAFSDRSGYDYLGTIAAGYKAMIAAAQEK